VYTLVFCVPDATHLCDTLDHDISSCDSSGRGCCFACPPANGGRVVGAAALLRGGRRFGSVRGRSGNGRAGAAVGVPPAGIAAVARPALAVATRVEVIRVVCDPERGAAARSGRASAGGAGWRATPVGVARAVTRSYAARRRPAWGAVRARRAARDVTAARRVISPELCVMTDQRRVRAAVTGQSLAFSGGGRSRPTLAIFYEGTLRSIFPIPRDDRTRPGAWMSWLCGARRRRRG
jgi:hypothetical protein